MTEKATAIAYIPYLQGFKDEKVRGEKEVRHFAKNKGVTILEWFYTEVPGRTDYSFALEDQQNMTELTKRRWSELSRKALEAATEAVRLKVKYFITPYNGGHWSSINIWDVGGDTATAAERQIALALICRGITVARVRGGECVMEDLHGIDPKRWDVLYRKNIEHQICASSDKAKGERLAQGRAKKRAEAGKCEGVKGWGDYPEDRTRMLKRIRQLRKRPKGCTKSMSFNEIAKTLNEEGMMTFTGKSWTGSGVANFYADWNVLSKEKEKHLALRTKTILKEREEEEKPNASGGDVKDEPDDVEERGIEEDDGDDGAEILKDERGYNE